MHLQTPLHKTTSGWLSLIVLATCSALAVHAVDMGGVAVHGSLSSTASYSPEYNYIGDTKESLDLNQTELTVNGTKRFDNGIKLAVQLYGYELAGYEDLTVDFANVDYSFRQEVGISVGRNKLPFGFYNESQDLDQVRVFASLPLNFYPRALRPFGASYDGGALYGNIPAGKAGSFDYQAYVGVIPSIDPEMPFMAGYGATKIVVNIVEGVALIWNTPVDGLRIGYSARIVPEADVEAGVVVTTLDAATHVVSVEYTRGKWTASAEYSYSDNTTAFVNVPLDSITANDQHSYVQLTYQATGKLGLGVYYAYSDFDGKGVDKDIAFASAYSIQPWWVVKAEVHLMDGISNLGNAGDSNPGATDETWTYFVLKTTLSF